MSFYLELSVLNKNYSCVSLVLENKEINIHIHDKNMNNGAVLCGEYIGRTERENVFITWGIWC